MLSLVSQRWYTLVVMRNWDTAAMNAFPCPNRTTNFVFRQVSSQTFARSAFSGNAFSLQKGVALKNLLANATQSKLTLRLADTINMPVTLLEHVNWDI